MRIGILGPLEVWTDSGAPLEVSGARLRGLLIRLALRPGEIVPAGRLIDALWGGRPPAGAANALQALVSRLRRALPDGVVASDSAGYRLTVPPDAVDACRFERLVADGRALRAHDPGRAVSVLSEALALWRGPALLDVEDELAAVARLTELKLTAVEDLAEAELFAGIVRPDVVRLEALITEHPTRERAVGLLMRALCAAGRSADALDAYQRLRTTLADELGTDPSTELRELHLRILRGDLQPVPAQPAPPRTNLRAGITSFVGRDEDVTRVRKLVHDFRLTTLTGPGGAGKTRLALESAQPLISENRDGVWVAELAAVSSAADLPMALLAALGLRDQTVLPRGRTPSRDRFAWESHLDELARYLDTGADSIDRLTAAVGGKQLLLILDNCEHLVDAVAALAEHLLGASPTLRVLATSREPLGITGEVLWPVEPLPLPSVDASALEAASNAAVRLFADRAAAAHPDFTLDHFSAPDVVRICRALDGMPLAIELAAARLRTMTTRQVADLLDDRFALLTTGSRTATARHKTLRAVVDWSWGLLDAAERTLLRRLAFFSGGANAEAATRVMADTPWASDVLAMLTALAEKSLLVPERNGDLRYRMLETIKAYGLQRLAEAGETTQVRRAHAQYFLELAEAAEPHVRSGSQLHWLSRLDTDRENVHNALRGAIAAGEAETAVRFVAALGWYWNIRAKRVEGIELAAEALALPGDAPELARAVAYANASMCGIYGVLSEDQAATWFNAAQEIISRIGAPHPILRLVGPLHGVLDAWRHGIGWTVPDDLVADPDPWVRGYALIIRAYGAIFGRRGHRLAEADVNASVTAFRASGDRSGIAMSLTGAADVASCLGDFAVAADRIEEALHLLGELGSLEDIAGLRATLARTCYLMGDQRRAEAELLEAERFADRVGLSDAHVAVAITGAELARLSGDPVTARKRLDKGAALVGELAPWLDGAARLATQQGYLATMEGDLDAARSHHRAALETAVSFGDPSLVAGSAVGVADYALARGNPADSARLLSASVAVRGTTDRSLPDSARIEAAARSALSEDRFAKEYELGQLADTVAGVRQLAEVTLSS